MLSTSLPALDAIIGIGLLLAVAALFSWAGWRVLLARGAGWLFVFAAASSLVLASLKTLQVYVLSETGAALVQRPGALPANLLILAILYGTGFTGAAGMLWRHSRSSSAAPRRPLQMGLLGFALGMAVPLLLALVRAIRPSP